MSSPLSLTHTHTHSLSFFLYNKACIFTKYVRVRVPGLEQREREREREREKEKVVKRKYFPLFSSNNPVWNIHLHSHTRTHSVIDTHAHARTSTLSRSCQASRSSPPLYFFPLAPLSFYSLGVVVGG